MRGWLVRLAAVALAVLGTATAPQAQPSVKLTLGSTGMLYVPVYLADRMGLWKEAGITVDVQYVTSGSRLAAAIVSGNTEFTVQSITPSFLARDKGADTQCIGAIVGQMASNLVVSKAWAQKTGITPASTYEQRLAALKGARIAITSPGSGSDNVARYLARQAGLNVERDLTLVTIGNTTSMVPALANNSIDAFTSSPPMPDIAVSQFGAVTLLDLIGGQVKSLDGFMYQGVLVRQSWAEAHPKEVVSVMRGLQKALDVIHDPVRTNAARDLIWKGYYAKTEKDVFDRIWTAMEAAFPKTVELNQAKIDQVLAFERESGAVVSPQAARSGWRNDFAEQAVKAEGR